MKPREVDVQAVHVPPKGTYTIRYQVINPGARRMKRILALNDRGLRVGDSHHNAKLTQAEVDLLLEMHDEGWGYLRLGRAFDISKSGARAICNGRNRCQTPTRWKVVNTDAPDDSPPDTNPF